MKLNVFFVALIIAFLGVFSAFGADSDNAGTYQQPAITKDYVVYTVTLTYGLTDSTDDLHTKAMNVGFWDVFKPITVQIWGNGSTGIDVNVDAEFSAELNDTQFMTSSSFDIDAAGGTAAKADIIFGTPVDSTGVPSDANVFMPYMRLEVDGQAGNPGGDGSTAAVIYLKVIVPVAPGHTEAEVRSLAGFTPTS